MAQKDKGKSKEGDDVNWKEEIARQGGLPKDLVKLTDLFLASLHEEAMRHYKAGDYRKAADILTTLLQVNPKKFAYLETIALCYQGMKEYHSAAKFFEVLCRMRPRDPYPHLQMAQAFLFAEDPQKAYHQLKETIRLCEGQEKYALLKKQALARLEALREAQKEKESDAG